MRTPRLEPGGFPKLPLPLPIPYAPMEATRARLSLEQVLPRSYEQ